MSEYRWLNDLSQKFLESDYLRENQTVDDRVWEIANNAEKLLGKPGYAQRLVDVVKKGWLSFSTPVWANSSTERALNISCFGQTVYNTMNSIVTNLSETIIMTKNGGGTAADFSHIQARGTKTKDGVISSGPVHFMQLWDTAMTVTSQGQVRRGSFAAYLRIDHSDIDEFLNIKSEGNPIQHLSYGITIPRGWMQSMIDGDEQKRKTWGKVLKSRAQKGYPYIVFLDNVNDYAPQVYKDKELEITHSQLCVEIFLHDSDVYSFVCCLLSANMLYFDEWCDTDFIEIAMYLMEALCIEFEQKASKIPYMEKAVKFVREQRAVGLGWLGWHSYLQSKMIPWESMQAKADNVKIAKYMQEKTLEASRKLAVEYGEPDMLKGYGLRFLATSATAPTQSSSFILGQVSKGIEPERSNYLITDLAKGKFTVRNPYLSKLLEEKGKNTEEIWLSILKNSGSVHHLDFLSEWEKSVFKTFKEISPMEIIIQASQRQRYIDQGQSLNLIIDPRTPTKEVNALIIEAWRLKIKSLYYQHSESAAQELSRSINSCTSCEA